MNSQICRLIIWSFILWGAVTLTGCGNDRYIIKNKKADDDISKAVYDQLGKKMCYQRKSYNEHNEILYYFYVINDYKDKNLLTDMVETVNETVKEEEITSRICLVIQEVRGGGTRTVVWLSNYYEDDSGYEPYETLQCLEIRGAEGEEERYNQVATYTNLKDIKALSVEQRFSKIAKEEGIDWYEIWTGLEHYEIFNEYAH